MSTLYELRSHMLERLERGVGDLSVRARAGAAIYRSVEFISWCPACQVDDHFNHAPRKPNPKRRGPDAAAGACWTLENIDQRLCRCPWRPLDG